jgi:predicted GNAT superfamily acetyltransferase
MSVRVDRVRDFASCVATLPIQRELCGDNAIIPPELLHAIVRQSGFVAVAQGADERPAGFVCGLLGIHEYHFRYHSHVLAVDGHDENAEVRFALRDAERDHCLDLGIEIVTWLIDPLDRDDAAFSLGRLGAYSREYLLGSGSASEARQASGLSASGDRLYVEWPIGAARTYRRLRGEEAAPALEKAEGEGIPYLLKSEHGEPAPGAAPQHESHLLVDSPPSLKRDAELEIRWREATRETFVAALSRGYAAVDFLLSPDGRGAYLLVPQPHRDTEP